MRNARFQQLEAILNNRTKRTRAGEFLVQGVRPITLAVEQGWKIRTLIFTADQKLSQWARELLTVDAETIAMSSELMAELSGKDKGATEMLAVVEMPQDDLARIPVTPNFLGLVFDRRAMWARSSDPQTHSVPPV
ncbi:hypothetical protein [Timonella senegalensis]|uniref:hypothetical protein n=1 Tax=Timonella senegalensis TaxID=1465825 RepID=UPI002FE31B01